MKNLCKQKCKVLLAHTYTSSYVQPYVSIYVCIICDSVNSLMNSHPMMWRILCVYDTILV